MASVSKTERTIIHCRVHEVRSSYSNRREYKVSCVTLRYASQLHQKTYSRRIELFPGAKRLSTENAEMSPYIRRMLEFENLITTPFPKHGNKTYCTYILAELRLQVSRVRTPPLPALTLANCTLSRFYLLFLSRLTVVMFKGSIASGEYRPTASRSSV